MLTANKVFQQINTLTAELIDTGLCDSQNFPSRTEISVNIEEIGISGAPRFRSVLVIFNRG